MRQRVLQRTQCLPAILCGALCFNASADDEHVALVKQVTGDVQIVRDAGPMPASSGMTLFKTDRVVAGAASSAGLVFKDGTLLSVGPATDVAIRDNSFEPAKNAFAFGLYLAKGTAMYSSGKIGKLAPEAVDIATPRATVGVRGTRFIVTAE